MAHERFGFCRDRKDLFDAAERREGGRTEHPARPTDPTRASASEGKTAHPSRTRWDRSFVVCLAKPQRPSDAMVFDTFVPVLRFNPIRSDPNQTGLRVSLRPRAWCQWRAREKPKPPFARARNTVFLETGVTPPRHPVSVSRDGVRLSVSGERGVFLGVRRRTRDVVLPTIPAFRWRNNPG